MTAAIDNYPGVHLKTILAQVGLALMKPTPAVDSQDAMKILEDVGNAAYVAKIKALYRQIDSMHDFAKEIK